MDVSRVRWALDSLGVDRLLSIQDMNSAWIVFEAMAREGAVVLVKVDGERVGEEDNGKYTVLASGGGLRGEVVRRDSHDLLDAIEYLVVRYVEITRQRG